MKNNFPLILKELREKKRLSQTDLSKELNIARSTLSNYENGDSEPILCNLIKLANFFECSMDELVFGNKNNQPLDLEYNAYSHKLNDVLKQINKIELDKIISSIESIKNDFDELDKIKNK